MRTVDEWHETRLKNLFTSVRNGLWGDDPDGETGVFCARGTDFDRTTNRISDAQMPRRSVASGALRDHRLRRGDLVLEKSGGSADQPVGSVAMFDLDIPTVCSNFNARMQVSTDVDSSFACYLMNGLYGSGFTRQFIKQTTGIQNLDAGAFLAQHCRLPQLDEQRRIADFLDIETSRIDRLIGLRRRQIVLFEERYKVAISELVTPGVTSCNAPSSLWPWLPASIRMARLGYSARVQSGVTVHEGRERTVADSEYPYLRVANVQGEDIDLSSIKTILIPPSMAGRSTLRPGDVVMTEANGNPDNLGRGAVWQGEIPNMVHQNHVFAIRVNQRKLLPAFLSVLMASVHGRRYFRFTSNQVGIATTSSSKVLDFPVPVISLEAQRLTVDHCQQVRQGVTQAIEPLSRQIALLTERKQALITAAVTGQCDVTTARGVAV